MKPSFSDIRGRRCDIIDLVDCENHHKPQEELEERKPTSETVPYRNHPDAQDHEEAERHERPTDDPCAVEQLFGSRLDDRLGLFGSRGEEPLVLNERHRRQQHQCDRRAEHDRQKNGQEHNASPREDNRIARLVSTYHYRRKRAYFQDNLYSNSC